MKASKHFSLSKLRNSTVSSAIYLVLCWQRFLMPMLVNTHPKSWKCDATLRYLFVPKDNMVGYCGQKNFFSCWNDSRGGERSFFIIHSQFLTSILVFLYPDYIVSILIAKSDEAMREQSKASIRSEVMVHRVTLMTFSVTLAHNAATGNVRSQTQTGRQIWRNHLEMEGSAITIRTLSACVYEKWAELESVFEFFF